MVRRGYVQVAVDALGTGASEGGWELFGEDEQAGFANMDVDNAVTFNTEYSGNAGLSRTYVSAHAIDSGACHAAFQRVAFSFFTGGRSAALTHIER